MQNLVCLLADKDTMNIHQGRKHSKHKLQLRKKRVIGYLPERKARGGMCRGRSGDETLKLPMDNAAEAPIMPDIAVDMNQFLEELLQCNNITQIEDR
jgi:hypothetical protein